MTAGVLGQAREAMRWRALQLVGVRVIYFLRLLILAKLLVPEDFGLLAIATIAVGTLMTLSNVGMLSAVPGLVIAGCAGVGSIAAMLWLMNRWLGLELAALMSLVLNRRAA